MHFIDPRTDFAFRKIFGSDNHKDVLRSFLNALLYEGKPEIQQLQLLDPHNVPRLEGMKDSYLDVRIQQANGKWILVEMQVLKLTGFDKRVLFNAAKQYSNQVQRGEDYSSVNPVVALTITDFVMFSQYPDVLSRYRLIEKDRLVHYSTGDIELVFAELPKFTKTHDEATHLWEKWLCFLKEAGSLKAVPTSLGCVPEIQEAFEIANYAGLTENEADILDKKMQWWHDQRRLQKENEEAKKSHEEMKKSREEMKKSNEEINMRLNEAHAKLRQTAAALSQSGMSKENICGIMNLSLQELEKLLTQSLQ